MYYQGGDVVEESLDELECKCGSCAFTALIDRERGLHYLKCDSCGKEYKLTITITRKFDRRPINRIQKIVSTYATVEE